MWMLWTVLLVLLPAGQDQHQVMNDRGAIAMGFDQEKTAHHFLLFTDGGAIDIAVKDPHDAKDRDAIRAHLPHIAMMFGNGDFDVPMLVHDTKDVPGVKLLSERKGAIVYRYNETTAGGRVDIMTADPQALTALHAFLRYQIREHRTGDPDIVTPRR